MMHVLPLPEELLNPYHVAVTERDTLVSDIGMAIQERYPMVTDETLVHIAKTARIARIPIMAEVWARRAAQYTHPLTRAVHRQMVQALADDADTYMDPATEDEVEEWMAQM